MKIIFKYQWNVRAEQFTLKIPKGAKILSIQTQQDIPTPWAEVEANNSMEIRKFADYNTGDELPDNPGEYIGTYCVKNDSIVGHIYEIT